MTKPWTEAEVRELISYVRVNPPLYAKKDKTYHMDVKSRNLAWAAVGSQLTPPCTGEDAYRRFRSLRDVFNKERKKATMRSSSLNPRGLACPSTWEFYADMEFIGDHILPRKQMPRRKIVTASNQPTQMMFTPQAPVFLVNSMMAADGSVGEELVNYSSPITEMKPQNNEAFMTPPSTSTHNESDGDQESSSSTNSDVLRVRTFHNYDSKPPKLQKIEPSASRRQEQAIGKLSKSAACIAEVLSTWNKNKQEQKDSSNKEWPATSQMVHFALQFVPMERQTQCVMDLLKVIEIYRNGGGPVNIIHVVQNS